MDIQPIAYFHSPLTSKFGIPKQSGIVDILEGTIVFEKQYRNPDALRGIEKFDYLWLIWEFSANKHEATSLMVRLLVWEATKRWVCLPAAALFAPILWGFHR
jgi:tRNA (Thr-GGU) A37 N-methylase